MSAASSVGSIATVEYGCAACRAVDQIYDVVQAGSERMYVLAVERRHERPVETNDDLVREFVRFVLHVLDRAGKVDEPRRFGEQLMEEPAGSYQPVGEPIEQREEAFVSWDEAQLAESGVGQ
jgi:hypothetical protein